MLGVHNDTVWMRVYTVLLFAILPLLVFPWNNNVFYDVKLIFALIITAAMLAMLIVHKAKLLSLALSDRILVIYIILSICSTVFSIDFKTSIFGMSGIREGLVNIMLYAVIYFIFSREFTFSDKVVDMVMICAVAISLLGVLQHYTLIPKFVTWDSLPWNGNLTTLGNRNFAGSYCILLLPFSICFFMNKGYKRFFIYSISIFALLLASMTRSGWVAFAITFPGLLILLWKNKMARVRWLYVLAAFGLIFLLMNGIVPATEVTITEKVGTIVEDVKHVENDESGSGRIYIWRNLIPRIVERPLVGNGLDTFGVLYEKYPAKTRLQFDKAHNEYLQIAVTQGLPALIIYILFVAIIVIRLFLVRDRQIINVPILLSIVGYVMQAFFNISVISAAPLYWAVLGMAVYQTEHINLY